MLRLYKPFHYGVLLHRTTAIIASLNSTGAETPYGYDAENYGEAHQD